MTEIYIDSSAVIAPSSVHEKLICLQDSAMFRKMQRVAHIGSWSLDSQSGLLQWSDEIYRIFELDPGIVEPSYNVLLQTVHPKDRDEIEAAYTAMQNSRLPITVEYRLLMPERRIKYVIQECETRFDEAGNAISTFGTIQDITAIKTLQIENETNKQMLFHQSKMAQMGEMIDSIAHQWRQPLYQINSLLPLIDMHFANGTLTGESLSNMLDEIEMLTEHMSQTVDDFRNFYHPKKIPALFSISEALHKATRLFCSDLDHGNIAYRFDIMKDYTVMGYENEFMQAILILLSNAKDCFVHRNIREPAIIFKVSDNNCEVLIEISDNAGGIPEEHIGKIFDPYFTTKQERKGSGLGLHILKLLIVKSLQGTITAANNGDGAVFVIALEFDKARA